MLDFFAFLLLNVTFISQTVKTSAYGDVKGFKLLQLWNLTAHEDSSTATPVVRSWYERVWRVYNYIFVYGNIDVWSCRGIWKFTFKRQWWLL